MPRTPGRNPKELAADLNKMYYGYSKDDKSSPLGVTLNFPSDDRHFYNNMFCHDYRNPVTGKTSGCHLGQCDCRFSAALVNHLILITEGSTFMNVMNRKVAIILNQTLVETVLSRCFFVWDGATNNKLNVGCGIGGGGNECDPSKSTSSAYFNQCTKAGGGKGTCTADDDESLKGLCQKYGRGKSIYPPPVMHSQNFQCAYPGPAINYTGQDVEGWEPTKAWGGESVKDIFRESVDFRAANSAGSDMDGGKQVLKTKFWNEVVVDLRLMMPLIWKDPALVVPAIAYWKDDGVAKANARAMRDEFCKINQLSAKIPILALDWRAVIRDKQDMFVAMAGDNAAEEEVAV